MPNSSDSSTFLYDESRFLVKLSVIPLITLSLALLPVYVYVHEGNKERDKETAVFPITNHFYHSVKGILALSALLFLVFFAIPVFMHQKLIFFTLLSTGLLYSIFPILSLITQVQYVLLTLLAVQRVLIYFFPSFEKYANLSQKKMEFVIKGAYGGFIVKELVFTFFYFKKFGIKDEKEKLEETYRQIYVQAALYLLLHLLLAIAAILYIPLMISIRKFSHLSSAIQNQPQRYVLYQTITIVITKITSLPMLLLYLDRKLEIGRVLERLLMVAVGVDVIILSIMIQITYLCCNKRNLDVLRSYPVLKALKITLKTFCGLSVTPYQSNRVADKSGSTQ